LPARHSAQAIDRGVHQLSSLGKALDTDEDVDLVPDLGPKTAAKVKEILARGSSSRLEAARGDEQLQVAPAGRGMLACPTAGALPLNLCPCAACSFYEHPTAATSRIPPLQALNQFMEVWGVGSATAQRWYALGCRSLEDVRARAQELRLSEFQEVGTAAGRACSLRWAATERLVLLPGLWHTAELQCLTICLQNLL
jgi:DNA polymerase lambda